MLLRERMRDYPFSHSERLIVDYMLEKNMAVGDVSAREIARETYTSPSTLVRMAKKLGFDGWNDMKDAFLKETSYLESHFRALDANKPFTSTDNIMTIASKIANLHAESAMDTLSLTDHDTLQKAVRLLEDASEVRMFAIANLNYPCEEFVFKLRRINKRAFHDPVQDNQWHDALMTPKSACAVLMSYSGETPNLLKTAGYLKSAGVPMIAITSVGENSLSKIADVTLRLTTRERSFSKIAGFTSEASIKVVLDTLYACLFARNYDKNMAFKISVAEQLEHNRRIDNNIISED